MFQQHTLKLVPILLFIAVVMAANDSAARTVIDATVGKTVILALEGNPTTGYTWQARIPRKERSLISVDGCAWQAKAGTPKRMVGTPRIYSCRITPLRPGNATITFRYLRPWEKTNARPKTKTYLFKIK